MAFSYYFILLSLGASNSPTSACLTLAYFYCAWILLLRKRPDEADKQLQHAESLPTDFLFPNELESAIALLTLSVSRYHTAPYTASSAAAFSSDPCPRALFCLGNFYYSTGEMIRNRSK